MGESDRYIDQKNYYKRNHFLSGWQGDALLTLIIINSIFFLLLLFLKVTYSFYDLTPLQYNAQIIQWFQMPASLEKLSERPWTILTQMFCHTGIMEMLSNMLWLWCFGYILQGISGNKKLIPIYIYGGLAGAVLFILVHYLIPTAKPFVSTSYLHSAGASTMAIAVATTTLAPKYRFFKNLNGGIPIWVLLIIYAALNIVVLIKTNLPLSLAYSGGAIAGYLFIFLYKKGKDGSIWMNNLYNWLINAFNPYKQKKPVKEDFFYKSDGRNPYKKTAHITQQRIDEILDKINDHGYHFLTDEEKNILKKASEE